MPSISSPAIIQIRNAVGAVVIASARSLQFTGSNVVTTASPGFATIDGTDTDGTQPWDIAGNGGGGLLLGTTTADAWDLIYNGDPVAGFNALGQFFLNSPGAQKSVLNLDVDPSAGGGIAAPIGSLAICKVAGVGSLFQKIGAADTDWAAFSAAVPSVLSLNSLTGAVTLAAGTNVALTPAGNTITISASFTGVSSFNGLTNAVTISAGTNISFNTVGQNIQLNVVTFPGWALAANALTGALSVTPNEVFGSTNDYDIIFQRNSVEQMRAIDGGVLIGSVAPISSVSVAKLEITSTVAGASIYRETLISTSTMVFNTRMNIATTVGAATTNVQFSFASNNQNQLFELKVCVRQISGATGAVGDGAAFVKYILVQNIGGVGIVLDQQATYTYTIDAGITLVITSNGTGFRAACTGVAGRNLHWALRTESINAV